MKLKKLIGVLLSAIMVVSSITITAVNAENNDTENPLSDMTIPYTEEAIKLPAILRLRRNITETQSHGKQAIKIL